MSQTPYLSTLLKLELALPRLHVCGSPADLGTFGLAIADSLLIDTGSSNTWVGASKAYTLTNTSKDTGDNVVRSDMLMLFAPYLQAIIDGDLRLCLPIRKGVD